MGPGGGYLDQQLDKGCEYVCKAVGHNQTVHPVLLLSTNHQNYSDVDNDGGDENLDAGIQVAPISGLIDGSGAHCNNGFLVTTEEQCGCRHASSLQDLL